MKTGRSHSHSDPPQKRRRFSWILGIVLSSGFLVILAFVVLTLLVLRSQGITQGINTLTILSIVVGFVMSVLTLLVSFLQWHHPHSPHIAASSPTPILPSNTIESSQFPDAKLGEESRDAPHPLVHDSYSIRLGGVPHAGSFYGREQELVELKHWIVDNSCRMIVILGMGGIGKTSLAITLTDHIKDLFDAVFWTSLQNAPPLKSVLQECIQFLSPNQGTTLPEDTDNLISLLLRLSQERHCLLVLDNMESVLQSGRYASQYRAGYEEYGTLLQRLGEAEHHSCLLLTSREKPREISFLEGGTSTTRSLRLAGLKHLSGRQILKDKRLHGAEPVCDTLIDQYAGNPLALKLVSQYIQEVFDGEISSFLAEGERLFSDILDVLNQQFERLSMLEQQIMYWLAIEREVTSLKALQEMIISPVDRRTFQEALRSLHRRSLIEAHQTGYTLQNVILEYTTDRFVDSLIEEVRTGTYVLFESHTLMKAQAKEYVRASQVRLILQPIAKRLRSLLGEEALESTFTSLLSKLRESRSLLPGYAAGNILNLLVQLGYNLRHYDFSHLLIRQAYLQGVFLREVNFAHAHFEQSVFTNTFASVYAIAFSPDGTLLAAGTGTSGEIWIWHVLSGTSVHICRGHTKRLTSITFSPDGLLLASAGEDQTIRIWEAQTGRCLHILAGHFAHVWSVAFSPDGQLLASASSDRTVRLWDVKTGGCLRLLQGHTGEVRAVVFGPDGQQLTSRSDDQTVRRWEVRMGQCWHILESHAYVDDAWAVPFSPDGRMFTSLDADHTISIWDVETGSCLKLLPGSHQFIMATVFSSDGHMVASGGRDGLVRVWEIETGRCLHVLQGHTNWIWSLAFSQDGQMLASGGSGQDVYVWEVETGYRLRTFQGYLYHIRAVSVSPDGRRVASGSIDQGVRIWDTSTGECLSMLSGHTNWVLSVAFSPDNHMLASGSEDHSVRVWDATTGSCLHELFGHTDGVWSVAFSADGGKLFSGSNDRMVRVWDASTGSCLRILSGHSHGIGSIACSPDGRLIASGSNDRTIRIWETDTGTCVHVLRSSEASVRAVAFSADGSVLVSGSFDATVRVWEINSGQCLHILREHTEAVDTVAFHTDSRMFASGSRDQTVRVWETSTGRCLRVLQGHTGWVYSVSFSSSGQFLASGSEDGTIKLWELETGKCLNTLRSDRPYERMNITGVIGITEAQKTMLSVLGAIEKE